MTTLLSCLALAAGVLGLGGLLVQARLSRKVAAWCLLQGAFFLLLVSRSLPGPNPLAPALAMALGFSTLAGAAFLLALAGRIRREKRLEDERTLNVLEDAP